jgi:hypothetical protein
VTKAPGFLAAIAGASLLALVLSACGAPAGGSSGGDPADDVTFTIDDLRGLIEKGDGLSTLTFEASEVTATAADDAGSISGYWAESGGDPQECYAAFATSYVLDGSESGAGGDDDTMELGVYTEPADDDFGLVIVNARIFDSTDAAAGFLDSVAEFASGCPDGYTLSDGTDVIWDVTAFTTGTFAGAPDGVATATSEELIATGDAALRTTFIQRGNAVIAFYAETYNGGTYVLADVDPVITAVAGRLAAL